DWQARGAETAILLPADSKVHTWSFRYEPEARADPTWHDEALKRHVTDRTGNGQPYELQGEEHLFERLKREEPTLTQAFLLRTVFDYEYAEIGETLGRTEIAVRQIVSGARRRLGLEGGRRFHATGARAGALAERFVAVCRAGAVKAVESMLMEDVE